MEKTPAFEARKRDHIEISLEPRSQAAASFGIDQVSLIHEALPEIDFQEVSLQTSLLQYEFSAPYFISSMTAGHQGAKSINENLVLFAQDRNILMGVGSQRRELFDNDAGKEWRELRRLAPKAILAGNIGLTQLIQTPVDQILKLIDNLEAQFLFVHTNPLQESLQPEGTPQFRGGIRALEQICRQSTVPVVLKEVGCGISRSTLQKLNSVGLAAVDLSGMGGTHWGRVEAARYSENHHLIDSVWLFADWGQSAAMTLAEIGTLEFPFQLWASGGVRNGIHIAKYLSMGAEMVGMAQPWLKAVMNHEDPQQALHHLADKLNFELKISMFCTGCRSPQELRQARRWTWLKT